VTTLQHDTKADHHELASSTSPRPSTADDRAAAVLVKMTVQHLDFERLQSLHKVQTGLQRGVAGVIASQAGRGIDLEAIEVKLAPGSVHVDARVGDLTGARAMSLQSEFVASTTSLRAKLTSSIADVTDIDKACTGSITVVDLQAKAVARIASSAASSRTKATAWVCGILIACCCFLLGLLVWYHRTSICIRSGHQYAPLNAKDSNEELSHRKPLADPAATESLVADILKQHSKQQAKTGKKAEKQADAKKLKERGKSQLPSPQPSQEPSQQPSQQPSPQASQQPSQQPGERNTRQVRAKRRASKVDEDTQEGRKAPANTDCKPNGGKPSKHR